MRFMPQLLSPKQSEDFYNRMVSHQAEKGYCYYAVELINTKQWIGYIGFQDTRFEAAFTPATEIGYRLLPETWNQGLATEGSKACLDYGKNQLKLKKIVSFTAKINLPSQRVMQKIGLSYLSDFEHPLLKVEDPLRPHVLYQMINHD